MSEQNDKLADGDEMPPEAEAFEEKKNPPKDDGNVNADLKRVDDE